MPCCAPGSVRDISRMLRFAGHHGIRVVGRGAGHTVFGQSQHLAAIAFDLTTLDEIGPIVDGCITVDAAASGTPCCRRRWPKA